MKQHEAMKDFLFSYGTLQKEKTQLDLFGRVLKKWPDVLYGYKTKTIEIVDKNFLAKGEERFQQTLLETKNQKDHIKGTVLELSKEELPIADHYEPSNYTRIQVTLASEKQAWLYVAQ